MVMPSRNIPWGGAFAILLLLLLTPLSSSSETAPTTERKERKITAKHGAVAADDGRCSEVGRDVLKEGGHAVDAAVATALCLGVVNQCASGLGGGAFMLVRTADGNVKAFDMRETAPIKASKDMYNGDKKLKEYGALSIAVPGELAGLYEAWKQYGKLPWCRLVMPAANFSHHGFKIMPYLHKAMSDHEELIMHDEGLKSIYTSDGKLLQIGDTCYNKKLANTLLTIALDKLESFYHGEIAQNLVKDVQKVKGILSIDDMAQYKVEMRKPISTEFFGHEILGMPPPSSGGASIALILNILAQYGASLNSSTPLLTHRTIEALKYAFALRVNLGDPGFDGKIDKAKDDMISTEVAKKLHANIKDEKTFFPGHYGDRWNEVPDHGTSHVSIVDRDGNAVAMTTTINAYFGSKFLSPSTGILLNNQMDDFSMPLPAAANEPSTAPANEPSRAPAHEPPPAPANFIRPGKRPLSSTSPTIILEKSQDKKSLKAVIGGSGGYTIIGGVTEVLLNYFVNGMDPLHSIMAPRVYHPLIPNVVKFEDWTAVTEDKFILPGETRTFLEKRGHVLEHFGSGSVVQLVIKDSNELVAVSDPRKDGSPAGF